jgi:hypothetical protein
MASEAALERRCCAYAKGRGCLPLKLWPTLAGLPDRLILIPGARVWFVEFKTAAGRVSTIQWHIFSLLAKLGFPVAVVRDWPDFKAGLDQRINIA